MNTREAIDLAKRYATDMFADETIMDLGPEEVEFNDDGSQRSLHEYQSAERRWNGRSSEYPDRLLLDPGAQPWMEAVSGSVVDPTTDRILDDLISVHEGQEPKRPVRCRVDEDVDVGIGPALVAGMRTEEVKPVDARKAGSVPSNFAMI